MYNHTTFTMKHNFLSTWLCKKKIFWKFLIIQLNLFNIKINVKGNRHLLETPPFILRCRHTSYIFENFSHQTLDTKLYFNFFKKLHFIKVKNNHQYVNQSSLLTGKVYFLKRVQRKFLQWQINFTICTPNFVMRNTWQALWQVKVTFNLLLSFLTGREKLRSWSVIFKKEREVIRPHSHPNPSLSS